MELPPCIKAAVTMRDLDALDDILSFFRTFGDEKLEPVLWSIGYLTLDNYEQKKQTAISMMRTAPLFPCPKQKPETLAKYCDEKTCPYNDPFSVFKALVKDVRTEKGFSISDRYLIVELTSGHVYRLGPYTYHPLETPLFFVLGARDLVVRMRADGFNIPLDYRKVAGYLLHIIYKEYIPEDKALRATAEVRL